MLRTLLILAAFLLAPLWGTDSFTSATAGTTVYLPTNPLGFVQTGTYQVSGTFVATLQWQFSVDGRNWATYHTYTAPAGPIIFAAAGYYRFNCSNFTSGTAVGTVTLAPKIYQQQYASSGSLLFQVDDSGVTAAGLGSGAVSSVNGLTGAVVFAAGSNITLTPSGQTVTIASTGGGGSTPTGTGFTHITSGSQDGSARAVNVSSADITGTQTVPNGGLGVATLTPHGILVGAGTSAVVITSAGTTGQVLTSNGASADPSFQNAGGGGSFVSTGSVTSRTPADRAADVWNVQDFGAVADGTTAGAGTDNQAAFVAAVTAAHNAYVANGQPVGISLGKGLYALASAIPWQSGVKLYGPGGLVTKNASTYTGAMHSLITASGLVDIGFSEVTAWGVGPDQKIAGPATDTATLGGRDSFIDLDTTNGIVVERCSMLRFQNAALISESNTGRFVNNYINDLSSKTLAQLDAGTFTPYSFAGDPGGGVRFLGERSGVNQTESDNWVISSNVIIAVGLDIAIDLTSQSGYPFRCQCTGNYCAGPNSCIQVYTSGAAVPDPGTLTTTDRSCNIQSNTCMWSNQQGIYIRGVEGVLCEGNRVDRCAISGNGVGTSDGGIVERGTTNSTYPTSPVSHDLMNLITGNQVIDCGSPTSGILDAGIRADALHSQVSNNEITRSVDRFGANINVSGSKGLIALDTGTVAALRLGDFKNNIIRGFNVGIDIAYNSAHTQLSGGYSATISGNHISNVVTGISVNTLSSGYQIMDNTVTDPAGTSIGIYVKNTPFTKINRNFVEGYLTGIQLGSGSLASDYFVTGGRQGPTLTLNDNQINLATTPISIAETATGDVNVSSRCLTATGNLIDGAPFNRDATGSFTFTAAPTASVFRTWHIGDVAPQRTPTAGGPGWVCTTAGAFGAAIATTATTTNGSATVTFSGLTAVVPDDYISIAGVTGAKHVLSISVAGNTCVVDVVCDASVSGAAITRPAPVFSNVIPVTQGGTQLATATAHGVLIGEGTSAMAVTAAGTSGQVLTSNGASADPTYQTPAASGVTSVGLSLPAIITVSGSPVTTTGTLTGTLATQTANTVWAGPTTGAAAAPTFRPMVTADMPSSVALLTANTFTGEQTLPASTTGTAGINVPHGSAPTSPANGDLWSTTAGFFGQVNGSTIGPFATASGSGFPVSTATYAVQDGTDVTKQQKWNLASATTGTILTLKGQQTTSQTVAFPNSTAADTVATLGVANAFAPTVVSGVNPPVGFSYTGALNTTLTAGNAGTGAFVIDMSPSQQWTGGSGVTGYAGISIKHPVLAATSATTFTAPVTMIIDGPPTAGTNGTVSGGIALQVTSGTVSVGGTLALKTATSNIVVTQGNASSGAAQMALFTAGAHTNQTASTEVTDVNFNLARTVQHATGALTTQRAMVVQAPTYSFVGASTITTADTFAISGAPVAGTNATITSANATDTSVIAWYLIEPAP